MTASSKPQPSIDFGYPTLADGPVPAFNSIEEEAEFWDTHDVTDFVRDDSAEIEIILGPELRQSVTVRLNVGDVEKLDQRAEEMGVEPAELVRRWVTERLHKEAS